MISKRYILLWFVIVLLTNNSCSRWDDYNKVNNPAFTTKLSDAIASNADLSAFNELLKSSGLDQVISSSKSFTVWAPSNEAMAKLDPALVKDSLSLRLFVANHIATQAYLTSAVKDSVYIKTLSGKNVTFKAGTVNDQPIVSADHYYANGVVHVINGTIKPRLNAWEYLLSTNFIQKKTLQSFNYQYFDKSIAKAVGVDPNTGITLYQPGSGILTLNRFLQSSNINSEDSLYTYIVLTDDAFGAERTKLSKFFQTGNKNITDSLTDFNIIKSLSFKGVYNADAFPDTVFSAIDSVKFHLDKSKIISTSRVSNGVVYVMSGVDYKLYSELNDSYAKIKPVVIEGEKLDSMLTPKAYTVRTRVANKKLFNDLLLENHGTANFWVNYKTQVNSVNYQVYWRVYRDYSLTPSGTATDLTYFPMKLAVNSPTNILFQKDKPGVVQSIDAITNKTVFKADGSAVYLGIYPSTSYINKGAGTGVLNFYLVGNNTTANGTNTLLLDYVKLVPIP